MRQQSQAQAADWQTVQWHKRMMTLIALALATVFALTAIAHARPDLRQMTCTQAKAMVKQNGQVVFTTSDTTYSMFVSNRRYCDRWETVRPHYAQTRDNPKCPVAYECYEPLFKHRSLFRD